MIQRGGDWAGPQLARPLLAVPNVTAQPSTAGVPITVLLYNGPLLCGSNVAIKELNVNYNAASVFVVTDLYYCAKAELCSFTRRRHYSGIGGVCGLRLIIIIIIIIADNKSFQRELTSPLTSIKLNKNNIKSLVSCRAVKFSKEKSFQFLLESWSAGGCPDVCGKDVPSCRTSTLNARSPNFSDVRGMIRVTFWVKSQSWYL